MSNSLLTPFAFATVAMEAAKKGQWPDVNRFDVNSQWSANDLGEIWILTLWAGEVMRWRKILTPDELSAIRQMTAWEVAYWLVKQMPDIFTPRTNTVLDLTTRLEEGLKRARELHAESSRLITDAVGQLIELQELLKNG